MTELAEFLRDAGPRKYRDLVQLHIKKQSIPQLMAGANGTVEMLPEATQKNVMEFIDAVNSRIGYDQNFWKHGDVKTAFGFIIQEAIKVLDVEESLKSEQDAYNAENHELAFNLFQIATLNFAYSAAQDKKQRKFMGIKKGFFS